LYLDSEHEYDQYTNKFKELGVTVYNDKKKYNFAESAVGSMNNGFYFTEGINKMFNLSRNHSKVLMLDEDSFFTTGKTIKFLIDNDFDFAYGTWPSPIPNDCEQINGSIVALNCNKLQELFPLPERLEYIENLLGSELHSQCLKRGFKTLAIPTRVYTNYGGDGSHTNDVEEIKKVLTEANIRFNI
jgi:hypothetical protein